MKKRVFIRYNWHGRSDEKWLFWLEKHAKALGCEVSVEEFHYTPYEKTKTDFVKNLQLSYGIAEENVYVVPHDPGCLTLMRYLDQVVSHNVTETVLLVAGIEKTIAEKSSDRSLVPKNADIRHPVIIKHTEKRFDARLVVLYNQDPLSLADVEKMKLSAAAAKLPFY